MIKIIKHGNKWGTYEFRCWNCMCEYIATVDNVKSEYSEGQNTAYCYCPECNTYNPSIKFTECD